MLKFEWNALRIGHRVVAHDPASAEMTLIPGVVAMIDTHVARKGANSVGIRVADSDGSSRMLWPSYLAVHHAPRDLTEPCWRCQDLAGRTASRPPTSPRQQSTDRTSALSSEIDASRAVPTAS